MTLTSYSVICFYFKPWLLAVCHIYHVSYRVFHSLIGYTMFSTPRLVIPCISLPDWLYHVFPSLIGYTMYSPPWLVIPCIPLPYWLYLVFPSLIGYTMCSPPWLVIQCISHPFLFTLLKIPRSEENLFAVLNWEENPGGKISRLEIVR